MTRFFLIFSSVNFFSVKKLELFMHFSSLNFHNTVTLKPLKLDCHPGQEARSGWAQSREV
uniref:Uncharacterized protein n=1 Tax=Magnetococcus massalia (strain MO-1) TaxID=451514 RepID=A0A1S7LHA7_MAGMO|nr:protein of unknown function [Candidatus Magnetococcus massalia]